MSEESDSTPREKEPPPPPPGLVPAEDSPFDMPQGSGVNGGLGWEPRPGEHDPSRRRRS